MNIQKIGTTALLALAGVLLAPTHSNAALAYADGDLILGFRGATQSYEVNIGQASSLLSATGPVTLSIGNIKADLDVLFPGWATSSSILWSLSGTKAVSGGVFTTARTTFASRAQNVAGGVLGTQDSTAWPRRSLTGQGTPTNEMVELAAKFAVGSNGTQIESTNSSFALIQSNSETNSYRSYMPGGDLGNSTSSAAYKEFAGGIEANFGLGADNAYLDLYDIRAGTNGTPSDFIGNVSIDGTSGAVTFTPEGVPEPTTVASLGAGLALLITRRRRQTA